MKANMNLFEGENPVPVEPAETPTIPEPNPNTPVDDVPPQPIKK